MKLLLPWIALLFITQASPAREAKEYDKDVNYDEGKTPHYDLPPLLISSQGKKITTPEQWRTIRRPEILSLFSHLIYGRIPEPASPLQVEFEVAKVRPDFMEGKATRKDIKIHLSNKIGRMAMHVIVFIPNEASKPVPCFLKHSFQDTGSKDFESSILHPGRLRNGWPLGKFIDHGYAFVAVYHEDLVRHNEVEFRSSIHKLFYPKGQSFPKAHEWGVISTCAWGAMRAMDYLETDQDIDHTRVAVMGHSKMGKTALWTAAQDERLPSQSQLNRVAQAQRSGVENQEKP